MPPSKHPRQHERIRGKRNYTIPKVCLDQGFITMKHQHHVERIERLAAKGIEIAKSSFPMQTIEIRIALRDDDVKDLLAGETIEKEYVCWECADGSDPLKETYAFVFRRPGEEPEWTLRTGKAPPGSDFIGGTTRLERKDS